MPFLLQLPQNIQLDAGMPQLDSFSPWYLTSNEAWKTRATDYFAHCSSSTSNCAGGGV